jgi:hypothetical protein
MNRVCLPDNIKFIYLVGEDKCDGGMQAAMDDIKRKLTDMSVVHYGTVPFIMAYTAAGDIVQFHCIFWDKIARKVWQFRVSMSHLWHHILMRILSCHGLSMLPCCSLKTFVLLQGVLTPVVTSVTNEIQLSQLRGRSQLVMALAKLYVLLVRMAEVVPARAGRYPVFHTLQRSVDVTVEIMPNRVIKSIHNFKNFCQEHRTSLEMLSAAYAAAEAEFSEAQRDRRSPALVHALEKPSVTKDHFRVTTGPLGYNSTPSSEQVRCSALDYTYYLTR